MTVELFYILFEGRAPAGSEVHHGAWTAERGKEYVGQLRRHPSVPRTRIPRPPAAGVRAGVRPCFAEKLCTPYHTTTRGRPSILPGRSFACTCLATSRASTASEEGSGAATTPCRCGSFCSSIPGNLSRTTPCSQGPAYGCPLMSTSRCLPLCSVY